MLTSALSSDAYTGLTLKAWALVNGGTGAIIKSSTNIVSVTKPGAGRYAFTFNAGTFIGTDYITKGYGEMTNGGMASPMYIGSGAVNAATTCEINAKTAAAALGDPRYVYVAFYE